MAGNDLGDVLRRVRSDSADSSFGAESCIVSTTANDTLDAVDVTLPYSEQPSIRHPVVWRLQFDLDGDGVTVIPRWPTRGKKGIVIMMDTGELWLIY